MSTPLGNTTTFLQYINRIQFGYGARRQLLEELARLHVRRPLVVSDQGVEASGVLSLATEALTTTGTATFFTEVPSNPTEGSVHAALQLYHEAGCDGLVAVGGGSAIDCAKAVALLLTHPGPLSMYLARLGGSERIRTAIAPLVAMPTTAGTGSEVGRGAGVALSDGEKGVFLSYFLVPAVAICDPELTLGLPAKLTAGTGIDAFAHGVEAFLSLAVNPPADAIALDAVGRLLRHLPVAVHDGQDREARWQVMMGALQSAMTTWKGLGAAHALSMPFDDMGLHHGTTVGVVLPDAVEFVLPAVTHEARTRLATVLGPGLDAPDIIAALAHDVGLPHGLADMGVSEEQLSGVGALAAGSAFGQTAPRRGTAEEYQTLAEAAYRGRRK